MTTTVSLVYLESLGLNYPLALAALYNASFVPCHLDVNYADAPLRLSEGAAMDILYKHYQYDAASVDTAVRIEELYGRPIYVVLTYAGIDPTEYDRANGGSGTLAKVLKSVGSSRNVSSSYIVTRHIQSVLQCCADQDM